MNVFRKRKLDMWNSVLKVTQSRLSFIAFGAVGLLTVWTMAGCMSSNTWLGEHQGVRYRIHKDSAWTRIQSDERGPFEYDSPELTVLVDRGELVINGVPSGQLHQGDVVEVTPERMVLVNKSFVGGVTTSSQ